MKKLIRFFDHLEDLVRGFLSHYPVIYGVIAGTAMVLFWRGVWETATIYNLHPITSIFIGLAGLLLTGVFVSSFIGSSLLVSGLKGEKKFEEKTLDEISEEGEILERIDQRLNRIEETIAEKKEN